MNQTITLNGRKLDIDLAGLMRIWVSTKRLPSGVIMLSERLTFEDGRVVQ